MIGKKLYSRKLEFYALQEYVIMMGSANRGYAASLAAAVNGDLTPRQREMILLYYVREKSMTEIARMLGVNVSTVSRTICRGRARLKRSLRYGGKALLEAV